MHSFFDFNAGELALKEPLPVFERIPATEKYLDDKQVMQERSSCQSVYVFCSKLEKYVEDFNNNKHFRGRLISFLESGEIFFIEILHRDWPRNEYVNRLVSYIHQLKETLDVKTSKPFPRHKLEILYSTLSASLKEVDYDLSRLRLANPRWVSDFKNYGMLLSDRTHSIFLINNLDSFFRHRFEVGSVFFIVVPVTNEQLALIYTRYYPICIMYRNNNGTSVLLEPFHSLTVFTHRIMRHTSEWHKNTISDDTKKLMDVIYKDMQGLLIEFEKYCRNFRIHSELNKFYIDYIFKKLYGLSFKVNNLPFENHANKNALASKIDGLANYFVKMNDNFNGIGLLPQTIHNGIRNISENSNLYSVTKENLFNENNLTAALLTWLKARLSYINFYFLQEEPVANGRTDISVYQDNQRISVIESKLVQEHASASDIRNKINSGVYQLYSKYSDSIALYFNTPPEMYFVLFCYNPDYRKIREHIAAALDDLSAEHSRLTLTHLESFRYRIHESGGKYPDKVVHITLIIAPLRTKDNNEEKHGKYLKNK
ncbi:hypothetical protein G9X43_19835 [Cronobacter turicensis]|uniref:hypothetical protein n=1 Tax=Cronobacter turicensis TaxID=413502 RepID=UPI001412423E|nr:hypothetical protein [Cronobacter turicensis]NHV11453.1 hypothetical protein [Cronobacter turicensis]NHV65140.1 hypothetical protein [Cronobacter turicensis]NHW12119.1 hypothetical protein [Cronobacter turicensis]